MIALLYVAFRDEVCLTVQEQWENKKITHPYVYLRYIDGEMIVHYFTRLGHPLLDAEEMVKNTRVAIERRAWVYKWKASLKTIVQLPFAEANRPPTSFNGICTRRCIVKIKNPDLRRALDTVLYTVNPNKGK